MRIAIAGQTWGPENGPGVFARRLAHGLAARGHSVLTMVPGNGMRGETASDGAVTVASIPALSLWPFYPEVRVTPAPRRSVRRALEEFRPDLVHIQDHYPLSRAVARAARVMGIPIVATNHFIPANMLAHMGLIGRLRVMETLLWEGLVGLFDQTNIVTTPTETAAAILRPHIHVAVRAISCGVDTDRFRVPTVTERAAARARWNVGTGEVLFSYVGRLDREKRLGVLIEAVSRVSAVRLIIAGRGRQREELEAVAHRFGAADRVVFAGFVSDSDLPSLLQASDFFAMPSDTELQSIATLEAMACGLPVLAANARALPELVENGVNGALFEAGDPADAADKMEMIVQASGVGRQASGEWMKMSRSSRGRAERHSLDATVDAYEEAYRGVRR